MEIYDKKRYNNINLYKCQIWDKYILNNTNVLGILSSDNKNYVEDKQRIEGDSYDFQF